MMKFYNYKLLATEKMNQFFEIIRKASSQHTLAKIVAEQQKQYDLKLCQFQDYSLSNLLEKYEEFNNKYYKYEKLKFYPQNWYDHERTVFLWFIIIYSYSRKQEGRNLTHNDWQQLSPVFFHKKPELLHFHVKSLEKNQNRIQWTLEEDQLLVSSIKKELPGKWSNVSWRIFLDSACFIFKSAKHCRERWLNHLDLTKKKGGWTLEEDYQIFKYVSQNGKRWSKMVPLLGEMRNEHMIKNRFHSVLQKIRATKKQKQEIVVTRALAHFSGLLNSQNPSMQEAQQNEVQIKIQNDSRQNVPTLIKEQYSSTEENRYKPKVVNSEASLPVDIKWNERPQPLPFYHSFFIHPEMNQVNPNISYFLLQNNTYQLMYPYNLSQQSTYLSETL